MNFKEAGDATTCANLLDQKEVFGGAHMLTRKPLLSGVLSGQAEM